MNFFLGPGHEPRPAHMRAGPASIDHFGIATKEAS